VLQMYKQLVDIAGKMKGTEIEFIIKKLSAKKTATKEEIELVHEMAKRTYSIELGRIAVNYLWDIALGADNLKVDKALVN